MPLNDEKLILQIQRGNTEYANELIEKHYPPFSLLHLGIVIIQTERKI